jgi:DNA-directed RNA polymerase specialized sigma24 family protein
MKTKDYSNTSACEAQLITAARAGETSGLVEYLYEHCLMGQALRLVNGFRSAYGVYLDAEDVTMEAMVYILRNLDKALSEAVNPVAWLLRVAKLRMLDYCKEQRGLVRVPARMQSKGVAVPAVLSLDAPLIDGEEFTLLDLLAS